MKAKPFDCVEMKRAGSRCVFERIKNMSLDEELSYWRAGAKRLDKRILAARHRRRRRLTKTR